MSLLISTTTSRASLTSLCASSDQVGGELILIYRQGHKVTFDPPFLRVQEKVLGEDSFLGLSWKRLLEVTL